MTIFSNVDHSVLVLILILAAGILIFSRFLLKESRYIYATGVSINSPKDQASITETKYEAYALEAYTMNRYEVKIDKKGNKHQYIKNHRWVPLDIDPEEAKNFISKYESGEEHLIINLSVLK